MSGIQFGEGKEKKVYIYYEEVQSRGDYDNQFGFYVDFKIDVLEKVGEVDVEERISEAALRLREVAFYVSFFQVYRVEFGVLLSVGGFFEQLGQFFLFAQAVFDVYFSGDFRRVFGVVIVGGDVVFVVFGVVVGGQLFGVDFDFYVVVVVVGVIIYFGVVVLQQLLVGRRSYVVERSEFFWLGLLGFVSEIFSVSGVYFFMGIYI